MTAGELYKMIDEIDWSQYETAYGNAAQDIPHFQAGKTPSVPGSLRELDDELKVELLDIFQGFAVYTERFSSDASWPLQLREKLKADLPVFTAVSGSKNEDTAYFAGSIVESLRQKGA